jgi:hypothetical protein
VRVLPKLGGHRLGLAPAEDADIGGFVGGGILAGRLAQRGGAGFGVEDVVDHLEQQPDAVGEAPEMFHGIGQGLSAVGAEQHGGAYQRAGLVDVHELELADGQLLADGREVDRLSAGHAARTRRPSPGD